MKLLLSLGHRASDESTQKGKILHQQGNNTVRKNSNQRRVTQTGMLELNIKRLWPNEEDSTVINKSWAILSFIDPISQRFKFEEKSESMEECSERLSNEIDLKSANHTAQTFNSINKGTHPNEAFRVFMTESQKSNYICDKSANFSYTGPSLIGLKWSAINTAKLTQGHKFVIESTQISNLDNQHSSEKHEKIEDSRSSRFIKYSNFMSKRVMSAKPIPKINKRMSLTKKLGSRVSEWSANRNPDNFSASHIIIKDLNENKIEWEDTAN